MKKSTKIMIIVVAAVLAICFVITACVSISHKNDDSPLPGGDTLQTTALQDSTSAGDLLTTSAPQNEPITLQSAILGKWTDSANMSGYEFFDDGYVTVTYVNLTVPVVNMPINGSTKGTYTIDSNVLTVKFSIYSKTITKTYNATVDGSSLTLIDLKDSDISTYERVSSSDIDEATTSSVNGGAVTEQTGITGGWSNSEGTWRYTFNEDGTMKVSLSNASIPAVSASLITGSYNGVYMADDDDITIQFMVDGQKVTLDYEYKISGNTMSLEDSHDDVILFIRGNGAASTDSNDLIGKWTDGSEMSGYEFKQGGVVDITYVNFTVPVINMPINGTYSGTYTVSGNKITINASIYAKSVTNTYTFSIQDNVLTLKGDDGSVSTYMKK